MINWKSGSSSRETPQIKVQIFDSALNMKSRVLSENEIIDILESCSEEKINEVFSDDVNEIDKASKAAHGGELVVSYR